MKVTAKTAALAATAVLLTARSAWAAPTVSNVSMAQLSGTRQVQITYVLGGEDAIVTLSIETNGVAIPDSALTALTGDVNQKVAPGSRTILWDAGVGWPENVTQTAKARVTAWSLDAPPQILVIDLNGGKDAATYPVLYYTSAEALPYGGLTNAIYKSSRLVMSKIAKGLFNMGEGTCWVTLTKDFYAGVFEVTQGQWAQVMGTNRVAQCVAKFTRIYRPMEKVSYYDIRDNPEGDGSAISPTWPESSVVGANSFMGLLRTKTALPGFDLPTEAQWEYACRAGTTTYFNDGFAGTLAAIAEARMNLLGCYVGNKVGNSTAIVGSYLPNTWGLYDMHGNVEEWCLDWHEVPLPGGTNPIGPASGTVRLARGGGWNGVATRCHSAYRPGYSPGTRTYTTGFRLVRTLP